VWCRHPNSSVSDGVRETGESSDQPRSLLVARPWDVGR
jgi:hypothetical protein